MHSYFLSDLHLTPERPAISQAFIKFLQGDAVSAERVYLLGDLFEYWIGDDAASLIGAEPILGAMHTLAQHVDCYFIAGNRDFLVRQEFSQKSGFKILPDESIIDLYGTQTLILHGDSLCTADLPHQQFRQQMVTNTDWSDTFLSLDIATRIEQAKQARSMSQQHKDQIDMQIMDVTNEAVLEAFARHQVKQMIHGHTHRQNTHQYEQSDGLAIRYVLGDWGQTNSILTASDNGRLHIDNQAI